MLVLIINITGEYQIKYSWLVSSIADGTISGVGAAPVDHTNASLYVEKSTVLNRAAALLIFQSSINRDKKIDRD